MPPVEYIKNLEVDPYTLQVQKTGESDDEKEGDLARNNKSAWKIRKPVKPNQSNLLTGYEQIITRKQQESQAARQSIRVDQVDGKATDGPSGTKNVAKMDNSGAKRRGSMPIG